ncbi:MAG: hypothetical protein KGD73_10535 [Candidatus Lokiarchaeota archaeon]|nr:hypothetical protein [Candidatus Lokiarchaeota archaeon]
MNKEKYYKILFIVAALYNIINSVTFILVSIVATDLFPLFGVEIPPSMIWLQLSLILIALFGVGYIMVSRDISKNHGLVLIGGLAKLSFFLLTMIYFLLGDVNILIVLLGGVDLIMVILFIEFLIFQSKNE